MYSFVSIKKSNWLTLVQLFYVICWPIPSCGNQSWGHHISLFWKNLATITWYYFWSCNLETVPDLKGSSSLSSRIPKEIEDIQVGGCTPLAHACRRTDVSAEHSWVESIVVEQQIPLNDTFISDFQVEKSQQQIWKSVQRLTCSRHTKCRWWRWNRWLKVPSLTIPSRNCNCIKKY